MPLSRLFEESPCPLLLAVLREELGGVGTQEAGMAPVIMQPGNVLFSTFMPETQRNRPLPETQGSEGRVYICQRGETKLP